jgi:phosphatidylglycerol lysyltransferase
LAALPLYDDHLDLADGRDWLEEFAFRYGRGYDSYFATEPGRECFWSWGWRGAVALVGRGRYQFVSGGLLAPPEHRETLLAQLVQRADARREVLTFFNVPEEDLPLFGHLGFQVTKWGEEALVDLPSCTWSGREFEWVRRQSNFCRRHGLVFSECRRQWTSPAQWERLMAEITEVSTLFLADKPQSGEMQLLESNFDAGCLGRKRIFVARSDEGKGRIEGFLACNPGQNGALWTMETYRRRPDAVRGTIPFIIHQAMQHLKREGVLRVSLCLIPGLRCREPRPGDSRLARWGIVVGTRYFNPLFDAAGSYHFKTRFRPRFEGRYLCVRPKMTLGSAWAMVRLLGVLRLDFKKLGQILVERWKKRASRATLFACEA